MIKTLEVSLGQVGGLSLLDPPAIVPTLNPGEVLATGYYVDQFTGEHYYYDAYYDQWYYVSAAGLLYPLEANPWVASPSPKISLIAGDTLRFTLDFYYIGPVATRTFRAAIGDDKEPGDTGSFAEWAGFNAEKDWVVPGSDSPMRHSSYYVDLVVPTGSDFWGHGGDNGAAYCKIMDGSPVVGKTITPYYCHVCYIVKAAGEFTSFGITKFEKV